MAVYTFVLLDICIYIYIHFRGWIRSCVNSLLFHYTFLQKTYIHDAPPTFKSNGHIIVIPLAAAAPATASC